MPEILVVDDEPGIRELMSEILQEEGYEVRLAENGSAARAALEDKVPDLVLLDIWMPDVDGVTLLKEWKMQGRLTMPVVMMSGHGTVHTAVEATRLGAFDYLEKPVAYKQLLETVKKAIDARPSRPKVSGDLSELGAGESIKRLTHRLTLAASAGLPVMLLGESATGVEVVARFLTPGGATLTVIEDPGDLADRPAELLAQAKGGMILVPEVETLTQMQQKGLVLLVSRRSEFGVRIAVTCMGAPADLLASGDLIQELYDQFLHAVVELPSLRDRREDIPGLAERMLEDACVRLLRPPRKLAKEALTVLSACDWRGNLAELESAMSRLALEDGEGEIGQDTVREMLGAGQAETARAGIELMIDLPLKEARDAFEKAYLEALLIECGWGMSRAAERAGLDRTNLYRKVKQLGIEQPGKGK